MEYTVNKIASISGVSTRTLRYYDEIGLLKPARINSNGYRIYESAELDQLQQILFYRELGVSIHEIKMLLSAPDFDRETALQEHLASLRSKKEQIEMLIENVSKTLRSMKGETIMSDEEKFKGFKQKLIQDNEQKYGAEIRKKYGDQTIDASNAKLSNMSSEQFDKAEHLRLQINDTLKEAMKTGNPACALAQKACDLHKQWICMFWEDGTYSAEAHKSLGEMYVTDERFQSYYDNNAKGCAEFLHQALDIYCDKQG